MCSPKSWACRIGSRQMLQTDSRRYLSKLWTQLDKHLMEAEERLNMSLVADTQHQVAALQHVLRSGQRQRSTA